MNKKIESLVIEQISRLGIEQGLISMLKRYTREIGKESADNLIADYLKNLTDIVQEMVGSEVDAKEALKNYFRQTVTLDNSKDFIELLFQACCMYQPFTADVGQKVVDPLLNLGIHLKLGTKIPGGRNTKTLAFMMHLLSFDSCVISEITEQEDIKYYIDDFARDFKEPGFSFVIDKNLFSSEPLAFVNVLDKIRNLGEVVDKMALAQYKIQALNTRNDKVKEAIDLMQPIIEKQKLEQEIDKSEKTNSLTHKV